MSGKRTWVMLLSLLWAAALLLPPAQGGGNRRGSLVIHSMIDGARVYIDGKLLGKTPFERPVRLAPGKHRLKATKAGYGTMELNFTVRPNRKTVLEVDLLPFSGLVKFESNVEGAEVYVDNQMVGHTPLVHDVVVGDHKVLIIKAGYNDFDTRLKVKPGEKHFVKGVLPPFADFSPEVLAVAKAQKDQQLETERLQQELTSQEAVESAPPWYAGLHKKWWVWAIAGAIVATAVVVPLAASGGEQSGMHNHDDAFHGEGRIEK